MGKAAPSGRVPLEALILAFSHSRAKALVGTDALRSVLSGQYRDLHHDGVFTLEPVWQLLSHQPGFSAENVRPALCRFKSWEKELHLTIHLPTAMTQLNAHEVTELAGLVVVPAHELARVLHGAKVPSDDPEAAAIDQTAKGRPSVAARVEPPQAPPPTVRTPLFRRLSPGQRRALEIAAIVLALAGFAVAGIQLQRGCSHHAWQDMPAQFAGEIPLRAAERQGPEVSGALRDPRWLSLPATVRTAQMKAALEALPRDVQVFFIRDRDGQVRAVARWYGSASRQIAVTLQ